MEEKIILDNADLNEGMIIGVQIEGEDLIKLRSFNKYLQNELENNGINLQQTIQYILANFLNEHVTISK
jgi:hypothetical protein